MTETLTETIDQMLSRIIKEQVAELESRLIERIEGVKDETVGIEKAMELTQLKKSSIYNLKCQGKIPCKKKGKRLLFSTLDLKKWIVGGRV